MGDLEEVFMREGKLYSSGNGPMYDFTIAHGGKVPEIGGIPVLLGLKKMIYINSMHGMKDLETKVHQNAPPEATKFIKVIVATEVVKKDPPNELNNEELRNYAIIAYLRMG